MKKLFKKIFCKEKQAIIPCLTLSGVIGEGSKFSSGINYENQAPLIKQAFETKKAKAVAILINSPGGSPVQSELIYNYIRQLSEEKKLPVYTFAQDVAASGGYWLLLSGDKIFAHNASIIGSIGVIFSGFGFTKLIEKIGVERRVYAEGKNKAILDPFMPEEKENIKILKEAQKDIFEGFADLVRSKRQDKLTDKEENLFTGAFWSGKKAQELGLIDEIADFRAKLQEDFGKKVKIEKIKVKKSLIKSFLSQKSDPFESLLNKIEEKISFNKFGL